MRALSLFERANGVELTLKEIANVVAILMIKEFEQKVVPEDERERLLDVRISYKEEEAGAWEVSRGAVINP